MLREEHRRKRKMVRRAEEEKARVKRQKQIQKEKLSKIKVIGTMNELEDELPKQMEEHQNR